MTTPSEPPYRYDDAARVSGVEALDGPPPRPPLTPLGDPAAGRGVLAVAGVLLLGLVFVVGIVVGQSGLLGRPFTGGGPTATPVVTPSAPTGSPAAPTPSMSPGAAADFALLFQAYDVIREHFVGRAELDATEVVYGAIRGMVEALGDTGHSVFLTPEALRREQQSLSGTIVGIGVLLGERAGEPVIVSVVSGSPASRAGLRSGDVFRTVDGREVDELAPDELAPLIRGDEGTTVELTIFRPDTNELLEFAIVREEISFPSATWTIVPGTDVGLLRLIQFSEGASEQLRAARDEAIAAGARSLILDLRSNPGGFVHEAVETASLFLDDETVYIRELASGERIPVATLPELPSTDLPMAVLIDEGTASSAEIVSGALQSAERAPLVGATTFGTGTVLLTYELADGSAVRIAVERWLTPDGELIFGQGIEPTEPVALDPDARALEPDEVRALEPDELATIGDVQLVRALELLGALP
jgi:carboxyl-terminal processing protease